MVFRGQYSFFKNKSKAFIWRNGEYKIRLIVDNEYGCDDTAYKRVYAEATTGKNGPGSTQPRVRIFPNPAKTHLQYELGAKADGPIQVSLRDLKGKAIYMNNFVKKGNHPLKRTIRFREYKLKKVYYLLHFKMPNQSITRKVLVY